MLNTAEKMIETVDYFGCGYCTSDLKKIFKGYDKTITDFYAGVFLIKHRKWAISFMTQVTPWIF